MKYWIVGVIMLGFVLWELKSGKVRGRGVTYRRYGEPVRYWMAMTVQAGVVVGLFWAGWDEGQARQSLAEAPFSTVAEETVFVRGSSETPSMVVASVPEPNWSGRGAAAAALLRSDQPAEALKLYDELLLETEADADLHYGRGTAQWKLGHTDAALADFRRTLELQPAHYHAVVSSDRILEPQARWSEILEMWNRYIAVESRIASAFLERAGTHRRMGNMAGAAADLTKACELGMTGTCAVAERLRAGGTP